MENLKILLLSITQGISELLPISSSAHLLLLGQIIDIDVSTLLMTTLHLGTSFALILFFRKKLFHNLFTKKKLLFYLKILISIVPVGLLGILYESKIEEVLRFNWIMAVSLIFWGVIMILADRKRFEKKKASLESISFKNTFLIGISQILALIPGTSRSGISTLTGIALGIDKYKSFEYSLIIGIPILFGSSLWEIYKVFSQGTSVAEVLLPEALLKLAIIILVPFVVGYIALLILKRIKREKWLTVFGIYRVIVGITVLLFL